MLTALTQSDCYLHEVFSCNFRAVHPCLNKNAPHRICHSKCSSLANCCSAAGHCHQTKTGASTGMLLLRLKHQWIRSECATFKPYQQDDLASSSRKYSNPRSEIGCKEWSSCHNVMECNNLTSHINTQIASSVFRRLTARSLQEVATGASTRSCCAVLRNKYGACVHEVSPRRRLWMWIECWKDT